jgi:hypothetical protein
VLLRILIGMLLGACLLACLAPWWVRRQRRKELVHALDEFKIRRELLEAKFFELASQMGKPRGLRWTQCDWKDEVRFARDVQTGLLTAFVSVEIHFEAIEGEDMEEVAAVGDIRDASALFHYQHGVWGTGGKALFNMNPSTAVERLAGQYEPVTRPDLPTRRNSHENSRTV